MTDYGGVMPNSGAFPPLLITLESRGGEVESFAFFGFQLSALVRGTTLEH